MLVSLFCQIHLSISGCVYLICSDGTVNETSVPNPLDTNHQLTKPESSQQPEVLHMTSDIVNKEPPHPYISLEELRPQKVRYYMIIMIVYVHIRYTPATS